MKIDSPDFRALFTPDLNVLKELFEKNGFEIRIAGGAVRDLLMGKPPADIDFASSATPQMMIELFDREGIRMLHKNGEQHGTVTVRIGESNFEVTTLRIDEVCDGRRAKVAFTTDWELDANRRDLTINSLFLDLDGSVVDYTGGIEDCGNHRVAFVGEPARRIQEDFLRILRYFRFYGRIAPESASHEPATIKAIVENKEGLAMVSPERIWTELRRLLVGPQAPGLVKTMVDDCGLGSLLGLPASAPTHYGRMEEVYAFGQRAERLHEGVKLESMAMFAALCSQKSEIDEFHAKTKLSNAERQLAEFIIEHREEAEKAKIGDQSRLTYWRQLLAREFGPTTAGKVRPDGDRIRSRLVQLAITVAAPDEVLKDLLECPAPAFFPVDGIDLMNAKVPAGPAMQFTKMYLFDLWVKSNFELTKDDLLGRAFDPEIPQPPPKEARGGKRKRTPSGTKDGK